MTKLSSGTLSPGPLVEVTETIGELDEPSYAEVIRVGYRVDWTDEDDRRSVHRYFPKERHAGTTPSRRITRTKVQRLGFAYALGMQANPLSLAPRSIFRRIIDASDERDFEASIDQYLRAVADAASSFAATNQVNLALEEILTNIRPLFDGVQPHEQVDAVRFAPSELSNSSLMRALEPSFDLGNELGYVPRSRLGMTLTQTLGVSEVLATTGDGNGIVAIDDLGDGLDAATAQHLAATAVHRTGQCWITTRLGGVAEAFEPSEVVRLSRHRDGRRRWRQGWTHKTKQDRKLVRNWYRLLAPVLNHRAIAVVEGPSDFAALHALCLILGRKVAPMGSSEPRTGHSQCGGTGIWWRPRKYSSWLSTLQTWASTRLPSLTETRMSRTILTRPARKRRFRSSDFPRESQSKRRFWTVFQSLRSSTRFRRLVTY